MATTASEADHTNFYVGLTAHDKKSAASEEHLGAPTGARNFVLWDFRKDTQML
jgi:hypothetical protein